MGERNIEEGRLLLGSGGAPELLHGQRKAAWGKTA